MTILTCHLRTSSSDRQDIGTMLRSNINSLEDLKLDLSSDANDREWDGWNNDVVDVQTDFLNEEIRVEE